MLIGASRYSSVILQNILVKAPGPSWWVKIGDFGISKRQEPEAATTAIGTGIYMAPERKGLFPQGIPCKYPSTAADVWALGLITWRIISSKPAFALHEVATYVIQEQPLSLESGLISNHCRDFVAHMLAASANKRPTCHAAAGHIWVQMHRTPEDIELSSAISDELQVIDYHSPIKTTENWNSWTTRSETFTFLRREGSQAKTQHQFDKIEPSSAKSTLLEGQGKQDQHGVVNDTKKQQDARGVDGPALELDGVGVGENPIITQQESAGLNSKEAGSTSAETEDPNNQKGTASMQLESVVDDAASALTALPSASSVIDDLHQLGMNCVHQQQYAQAEKHFREAVISREGKLGEEHLATLESVYSLSQVLFKLDQFQEAEEYSRRAFDGFEKTLGTEHGWTVSALRAIGQSLRVQDKHSEAEGFLQKAADINEKSLGMDNIETVMDMQTLASNLMAQDKITQAEAALRKIVPSLDKVFGTNDARALQIIYELGVLLHTQKKYSEALEWLFKASPRQDVTYLNSETKLQIPNYIGLCLQAQGKHKDAAGFFRKALNIHEKVLGWKDHRTLDSCYNLGMAFLGGGSNLLAEDYLWRALCGFVKILSADDRVVLDCTLNLAACFYRQQRYSKAAPHLSTVSREYEKTLGKDNDLTLRSVRLLGICQYHLRRFGESEGSLRMVLASYERVRDTEDSRMLECLQYLGLSLQEQNKNAEAEAYFQKAAAGREKAYGLQNRLTLNSIYQHGLSLNRLSRHAEAAAVLLKALRGREKVLGGTHQGTLLCYNEVGMALYFQGLYSSAEHYFQIAYDRGKKALEKNDPTTAAARNWLFRTLEQQHKSLPLRERMRNIFN
jgi:tetratricopeptide (TPR) repeat protein